MTTMKMSIINFYDNSRNYKGRGRLKTEGSFILAPKKAEVILHSAHCEVKGRLTKQKPKPKINKTNFLTALKLLRKCNFKITFSMNLLISQIVTVIMQHPVV